MTRNSRGDATVVLILVLGGAALLGFTKPWKSLTAQPPISELQQKQKELDDAKAKTATAEAALTKAKADSEQLKQDQLQYSQQMVHGANTVLGLAPQLPEVLVAQSLVTRADTGLAAAIGKLPPGLAKEIDDAVSIAYAAKDHQISVLNSELADKDAKLAAETKARQEAETAIPKLSAEVLAANAKQAAIQAVADAKQAEVNAYAAKEAEKDKETYGLQGLVNGLQKTAIILGGILALGICAYIFVHFILPSLAQQFPQAARLQKTYQAIASIASAHLISTEPAAPNQP